MQSIDLHYDDADDAVTIVLPDPRQGAYTMPFDDFRQLVEAGAPAFKKFAGDDFPRLLAAWYRAVLDIGQLRAKRAKFVN